MRSYMCSPPRHPVNKDVKVEVKQARPDAETAVVTFDYQGLAKTYNVVFSRSFVVMGNK